MFSSNSFGALAMDDSSGTGATAPPAQPAQGEPRLLEGDEVDVDWLRLVRTNHDVSVRVQDKVALDGLPSATCLLAVSNAKDALIVGGNNDVRVHRLSEVHKLLEKAAKDAQPTSTPAATINLPARPVWVRLALGDERIVIATLGAGVLLFKTDDVLAGNTTPYATINSGIPDQLLDVVPNPAASTEATAKLVTLLASEGFVLIDVEAGAPSAPLAGPFTAASWSVKGKQMVVGTREGKLVQYTPEGVAKAEVAPPPELEAGHFPCFVQWLENDLFLAGYGDGSDDELTIYVVHRTKTQATYTKFYDVNNAMGYVGRSGAARYVAGLKAWGDSKHISFVLSPIASEVGILRGMPAADKTNPTWESLILDETARAIMPTGKAGISDDTSPLGLALDLTATKPIVRGIVGGEELPDLPPPPRILVYSQEGFVLSFDIQNPEAGAYPGMVTPGASAAAPAPTAPAAAETKPSTGFGGFGSTPSSGFGQSSGSGFGQASSSGSAFGQSGFGSSNGFGSANKTPAFGSSGFGQSTGASAFGQSGSNTGGAFGQPSKPSSGFGQSSSTTPSAFGQSSTPTSAGAFGQSSTPGSGSAFGQSTTPSSGSTFGQSSAPSAFGQSSFGKSGFGSSTGGSAFGQSSFGQSGFGNTSTTPSKPAFGQSGFGSSEKQGSTTPAASPAKPSAFGSTSSTGGSAFGQSAFGKSAFGQSAFGGKTEDKDDSKTNNTATKDTKPAFTGFGNGAAPTPFGSSTQSKSAFGSTSTPSAFGSSSTSTPSAFGGTSTSTPSAFGSSSTSTPSAFGQSAFGKSSTSSAFGGSTTSAFGQSAFGQKSDTKPAFGGFGQKTDDKKSAGAFGAPVPATNSAFGAGSAFGQSSFGKPASGFGGFGQKSESKADETPQSPASDKDKDKDAGAFGLGGLGSTLSSAPKPAGLADSPPSSPKHRPGVVPGLEDDDDDGDEDSQPARQSSSTPTSSFIKPATAFASSGSSFGAFGKPAASTASPASTSGNGLPAAFASKPQESKDAKSPTTGPSAFGQPSALGQSAFGQKSAFGQASPLGAASPAKPSSPAPSTNITGGFGAFSKPSTTTAGDAADKPAFGGFGAFAKQTEGKSVFGDAKPTAFSFGQKEEKKEEQKDKKGDDKVIEKDDTKESPATKAVDKDAPSAEKSAKETPATPQKDTPATPQKDTSTKPQKDDNAATSNDAASTTPSATPEKKADTKDEHPAKGYDVPSDDKGTPEKTTSPDKDDVKAETPEATSKDTSKDDERPITPDAVEEADDDDDDADERTSLEAWLESDEEPDDDYEEYESDEGEEGEGSDDGEDDEEPLRSRRSFLSTPEMDTIPEDDETEDEDEGDGEDEEESTSPQTSPRPPKSPTWFATTPTAPGSASSSGSGGASLLSRMSPPPAQGPATSPTGGARSLPAFALKHAPKTSSPLAAGVIASEDSSGPPSLSDGEEAHPPDAATDEPQQKHRGFGNVGLGLAGAHPFAMHRDKDDSGDNGKFSFFPKKEEGEGKAKFFFGNKDDDKGDADDKSEVADKLKVGDKPKVDGKPKVDDKPNVDDKPKADESKTKDAPAFSFKPAAAAGEWTCDTCMLKNKPDATEKCAICEAPKPGAKPKPRAAAPATPPGPPAPPAGGFSFAGSTFGNKDKETAKGTTTATPPAPPTGGFSFAGSTFGSGKKDDAEPTTASKPDGMPAPPAASFFGSFGKPSESASPAKHDGVPTPPANSFFGSFGKPNSSTPASAAKPAGPQWTCDTCMCQSPDSASKCVVCDEPRPEGKKAADAKPGPLFGAASSKPAMTAAPLFGKTASTPQTPAPAQPAGGLFGSKPATPAAPLFGAQTAAPGSAPTLNFKPPSSGPATPATPGQAPFAPSVEPSPFMLATGAPTPLAPSPQPGSLFGGKPLFGDAKQAGGGLGLGRPPAPTTPSPFSLSPPTAAEAAPGAKSPTAPAPAQQPTLAASAQATAPTTQTYTPPSRPSVAHKPSAQPQGTSMAAAMERLMLDVQDDLAQLGATMSANKAHHAALDAKDFPAPDAASLDKHKALPFSTLQRVDAITKDLEAQLADVRAQVRQSDMTLAELQTRMLKTDMKVGQAEKFLKARRDPSFAKAMQIKELSPQQAAGQVRLRKMVQMTENRLDELEAGIAGLKRRATPRSAAGAAPALERIQRSVRNLDVAIRDRQDAVDALAHRVSGLRLSARSREGTPSAPSAPGTPARGGRAATPQRSRAERFLTPERAAKSPTPAPSTQKQPRPEAPSLSPTEAQRTAAAKEADTRRLVARAARAPRGKEGTAPVTRIARPSRAKRAPASLVAHASVASGPVRVDAMPVPGSMAAPPAPAPKLDSGPQKAGPSDTASATTPAHAPVSVHAPAHTAHTSAPPPFGAAPAAAPKASAPSTAPHAAPSTAPLFSSPALAAPGGLGLFGAQPSASSAGAGGTSLAPPGGTPSGGGATAPSAASAPSAPAPTGGLFANIKFNIDASKFGASTSSSTTASSEGDAPATTPSTARGHRSSPANRAHASAVKFTHTPVVPASGASGTLFGGVPPPSKPSDEQKKPEGFFSFSGFGK